MRAPPAKRTTLHTRVCMCCMYVFVCVYACIYTCAYMKGKNVHYGCSRWRAKFLRHRKSTFHHPTTTTTIILYARNFVCTYFMHCMSMYMCCMCVCLKGDGGRILFSTSKMLMCVAGGEEEEEEEEGAPMAGICAHE